MGQKASERYHSLLSETIKKSIFEKCSWRPPPAPLRTITSLRLSSHITSGKDKDVIRLTKLVSEWRETDTPSLFRGHFTWNLQLSIPTFLRVTVVAYEPVGHSTPNETSGGNTCEREMWRWFTGIFPAIKRLGCPLIRSNTVKIYFLNSIRYRV